MLFNTLITALLLCIFLFISVTVQEPPRITPDNFCYSVWGFSKRGNASQCDKYSIGEKLSNLPSLGGAYCFNNHSGICKGFSGRFEFLFNTFTDEIIGPIPKYSDDIDEFGFHKRIPVSYNINGSINYVDRSINWARQFKIELGNKTMSLLNIRDFNWCAYTVRDWWPYKSAIIDAKSKGRYHIYFFNRQSCIYDTKTKKRQHFNTRFLHKSGLRIDLDINPTIFAMEDRLTQPPNDIRLVKHRRQHWYEVEYEVIEKPTSTIAYFVKMSDTARTPCKLNLTSGPLFSRNAYRRFSDICISDHFQARNDEFKGTKNADLVQIGCGTDATEIADMSVAEMNNGVGGISEVILHSIPRHPPTVESFYGVNVRAKSDWEAFASDGLTFTATTTIPVPGDKNAVRVISLYSSYKARKNVDAYDEFYPLPLMADYIARYNRLFNKWSFDRNSKSKEVRELNYVDDIAYLYKCKTILVIFGPLYSELPANKFDISTKGPVDSIYELSLYELAPAFFNVPDTNDLWVYHRGNWVQKVQYTCGTNGGLVKASKSEGGKYYPRAGKNRLPLFRWPGPDQVAEYNQPTDYSEEFFYEALNIFKGNRLQSEAPNPDLYPIDNAPPPEPADEKDSLWIYIIIAIAVLLIISMCIIALITLRRRRHRRRMRESMMSPMSTNRSGMSRHHSSSLPSVRSGSVGRGSSSIPVSPRSSLRSPTHSKATTRSSLATNTGTPTSPSGHSTGTSRSSLGKQRSSSVSNKTQRSNLSPASAPASSRLASSGLASKPHSSQSSVKTSRSSRSDKSHSSRRTVRSGHLSSKHSKK